MAEDSLTARNRINQRNFRARRQNYIKDLEERLRKYESDGVQATIEIQTAARQVTEQNLRLRYLLTSRFSMTDAEIDAHIGITLQSLPSAIYPPSAPTAKSFSETKSISFQSIAPYPESTSSPITKDQTSVLSPALCLASLHRHSEPSSDSQPPSKRLKRNGTSDSSTSSLKSTDNASLSSGLSTDSPIPDREQDTVSESSNPQTPGEFTDSLLSQPGSLRPQRITTLVTPHLSILPCEVKTKSFSPDFFSQLSASATAVDALFPFKSDGPVQTLRNETSCEDAARIIASMRGSSVSGDEERPAQILLELGCRT